MTNSYYNRPLHVVAWVTAVCTFPLIWMGGLTTSHQAGLAVPDWPNSFGYNMFTFPISQWVGGIFYEHVHRLLGTVVGFWSVVLALTAWAPARRAFVRPLIAVGAAAALCVAATAGMGWAMAAPGEGRAMEHTFAGFLSLALMLGVAWFPRTREPRRWVRWLTVGILVAVIFQGILGGLRVVHVAIDLAVVHGIFAQLFFCLVALAVTVTGRWWAEAPGPVDSRAGRGLVRLGMVCVGLLFVQLVLGALMRHYQAGLAVPDYPLHYGQVIPPTTSGELAAANEVRFRELGLAGVSLGQVWLHVAHRWFAVVVAAGLIALHLRVMRHHADRRLRIPAIVLANLLLLQVALGIMTVMMRKPADVATAHVAVGALTLVTAFVLTTRAARLYHPLGVEARAEHGRPLPAGAVAA